MRSNGNGGRVSALSEDPPFLSRILRVYKDRTSPDSELQETGAGNSAPPNKRLGWIQFNRLSQAGGTPRYLKGRY